MTKETYEEQVEILEKSHRLAMYELMRTYAFSNCKYNIGDIFEDHIGRILIEKKLVHKSLGQITVEFHGVALIKGDKSNKKGTKRYAYLCNEKKV